MSECQREDPLLKKDKEKQTKPCLFLVTSHGREVTEFEWSFEVVRATSGNVYNIPGRDQALLLLRVLKGLALAAFCSPGTSCVPS